ncbi:hypothetical protein [Oceanospirillum maris]|jgi:uncharacterized protein YlxW (UPF0749 family)|uniref:hypothetical protein n=1 Tax=Oceanospirillum maris TaxID=64977 RepID=UPI00040E9FBA|nr:hypothetical protein [Oceanospirillum maris]
MTVYRSKTSPELLAILKRWQEDRRPEDAEFLADQMPHLLEDVARVQSGFIALKAKVKKLESEMEDYRQTRILAELDDEQIH